MSDPLALATPATAAPDFTPQGPATVLADRVEIFAQTPLPDLDAPGGQAFTARLKGESRATLFAIVCSEGLPVRGDILSTLIAKQHASLIRFRDSGMVDWPGGTMAGALPMRRYVLVFERPAGLRLSTVYSEGATQAPLDIERLIGLLIRPLTDLAAELGESGIAHGSLWPGNLFISPGGVMQAGECASCPTSYSLPQMFLTIERAQAHPAARGVARIADDLYAIAVTALIMALGYNPAAQMSEAGYMRLRLERGTFSALLGERSLKGMAPELFRNLLEDDPRRRWTMDDVETWLAGRRPNPKSVEAEVKPKRAFSVGDAESHTRRGVAQLLFESPLKGAATAETGELQRWIERSIENETLTKRAKEVFERAQNATGINQVTPLQLVAKAGILIDPHGPLRYKETALMPSGFGTYLAARMNVGAEIQPAIEMLAAKLEILWTEGQPDHRAEHIVVEQSLDRARLYIDRKVIGYGVERALYELMPWQTCLSPMVRDHGAMNVTQVLQALDRIGDNMGQQLPIDRHIAAFLIARDRRIPEGLLATLLAPDGSIKRIIGILTLLADAQYRHGPEKLRGLAQWMARLLDPVAKRFFENAMQDKARRDMQNAAARGDLVEMLNQLDSQEALNADRAGFEDARVIWQQAELDIHELQDDIDHRQDVERRVGQPLASGLSILLGIIALGFVIVMAMGGKYF